MQKVKTNWEFVADTVMGGVSYGQINSMAIDGRNATRLTGLVSLDNNGGFLQMATCLTRDALGTDGKNLVGIEVDVRGNDEYYDFRIRTDDLERPWQSFRAPFQAATRWKTIRLPFSIFEPHRTDKVLDPTKLRRFGIVAIGRVFYADIAVSAIRVF